MLEESDGKNYLICNFFFRFLSTELFYLPNYVLYVYASFDTLQVIVY